MPIKVAAALPVTSAQRAGLEDIARSSTSPHRKVVQAKALLWAADGVANAEIARQLSLSVKSVSNYVSNILSKLQVADRAAAILRAREAGLS